MRSSVLTVAGLFFSSVLFFGGVATEVAAQDVADRAEPNAQEMKTCGPPLQLPPGTEVVRLEGRLQATLPYGYTYGGIAADGAHFFSVIDTDLLSMSGPSDGSRLTEEVTVDCVCKKEGGTCTEKYNYKTGDATCVFIDCNDCRMILNKGGGEEGGGE